jgi:hypothetical protein
MKKIERTSGVSLTVPDDMGVAVSAPRPIKRAARPAARKGATESDRVLAALQHAEFEVVDRIPLKRGGASRKIARGTTRPATGKRTVRVEVPVKASQSAVLLVEEDGMYRFVLPPAEARPRTRTRGAARAAAGTIVFDVDIAARPARRTGVTRGRILDAVLGEVRTYVLRFAADLVIKGGVKYLERNVQRGFVDMRSKDPGRWSLVASLDALGLPEDRVPHILLFVHGTFSSTVGGFAALTGSPWGKALLDAARTKYDAIVGFDHPTLSVDPRVNAQALLDGLVQYEWKSPPAIDIVAHSRGGLVARSLVEDLLPGSQMKAAIGRIVFVGCTNEGTLLAEPDNWKDLVDLYTNLVAAGCRVLEAFGYATVAAVIIDDLVKVLGLFVKLLVAATVTDRAAPGIAAMEPDGDFVTNINKTQPGQPTPAQSNYYVVQSDFASKFLGKEGPDEFSPRFKLWLADGLIDKLMKEARNDLVVNTSSMSTIDVAAGKFVKDTYDFGTNAQVYHTNYFTRPEATQAMGAWLGVLPIEAPKVVRIARSMRAAKVKRVPTTSDLARRIARAPAVEPKRKNMKVDVPFKFPPLQLDRLIVRGKGIGLPGAPVASAKPAVKKTARRGPVKKAAERTPMKKAAKRGPSPAKQAMKRNAAKPPARAARGRSPYASGTMRSAPPSGDGGTVRGTARARPDAAPLRRTRNVATETCHFHAKMADAVVVNTNAEVDVTVSREMIEAARGPTSALAEATVDLAEQLRIRLVPKQNFKVVGDAFRDIDPPGTKKPIKLAFAVGATDLGDGEVWVTVQQAHSVLVTMKLFAKVVRQLERAPRRRSAKAESSLGGDVSGPLNQLTIVERVNGGTTTYDFSFLSESLEVRSECTSNPIRGDRASYVANLYKDIEERWVSSKRDAQDFAKDLRAFGADLLDELVPKELQKILWDNRNRVRSIQVVSTEPFIPWELVHLRNPDVPGMPAETCFLGQMGLIRWALGISKYNWPVKQIKIRAGKVYSVVPDYPVEDMELPSAAKESDFLKNKFGAKRLEAKAGKVRDFISKPGNFDLLHFVCHGEANSTAIADAKLLMKGSVDRSNGGERYIEDPFTAKVASKYCSIRAKDNAPMVVLNACQVGRQGYRLTSIGGFAEAFLKGGAGAFIGTLWSVGDAPASTFTIELYEQLLGSKTLSEATIAGREAARRGRDATWLAYVVYGHPYMTIAR